MTLKESGQMDLETVYVLSKKMSHVRSIDVAEQIGYSKPSVCRAIGILKKGGYVTVDENGYIALTELGISVTEQLYERHTILTRVLTSLGVNEQTAAGDACRIEHVISEESFEAIKKYVKDC